VRMGPLRLGRLAPGTAREATPAECQALERLRKSVEGRARAPTRAQPTRSSRRKGRRPQAKRKGSPETSR